MRFISDKMASISKKTAQAQAHRMHRWRSKFHAQTDPTNDFGYKRDRRDEDDYNMDLQKGFFANSKSRSYRTGTSSAITNTSSRMRAVKAQVLKLQELQQTHLALELPPADILPSTVPSSTRPYFGL